MKAAEATEQKNLGTGGPECEKPGDWGSLVSGPCGGRTPRSVS